MRLVCSHHQHHVAQARIVRQPPVTLGDLRRWHVFTAAFVDLRQIVSIADDGFFLEIADHAMRRARRGEIKQEEEIIEHALRDQHHRAFEQVGLCDLDKGHQVHALVFRLVHQCLDPAAVVAHAAQTFQMVQRRPDHAGHGRHGFQDHCAVSVTLGEEGIGEQAQRLDEAERNAVAYALCLVMHVEVDEGFGHGRTPFWTGMDW